MEKEKPKYNGKHPGGRPPKITNAWCKKTAKVLPAMFDQGQSIAEVCAKLEIWRGGFTKACSMSEEFSIAYKKGLELSEAWWAKLGRAGAAGKHPIQAATWIFNMKNRFGWKDKIEVKAEEKVVIVDARQEMEDRINRMRERKGLSGRVSLDESETDQ